MNFHQALNQGNGYRISGVNDGKNWLKTSDYLLSSLFFACSTINVKCFEREGNEWLCVGIRALNIHIRIPRSYMLDERRPKMNANHRSQIMSRMFVWIQSLKTVLNLEISLIYFFFFSLLY